MRVKHHESFYISFILNKKLLYFFNYLNIYICISFAIPFPKGEVFVLLIIYCSTKDIRICVLLLILFLVELDKENEQKINDKMLQLLIKDAALENKK